MHSSDLFERILSRFTTPEQAAAIIGDHLETAKTSKRPLWLTMTGLVIALAWRRPTNWLASLASGLMVMWIINHIHAMFFRHQPAALRQDLPRTLSYVLVTGATMLLSFAAPYAALRFGLRDRYARLCTALWCIAFTGCMLQPYRGVLIAIATACLVLILVCSLAPPWRAAAVALLATLAAGICGMILAGYWEGYWSQHHRVEYRWLARHTLWGFNLNPFVDPLVNSVILLVLLAATSSRMHNWVARKSDPATQLETRA